MSLKNNQVFFDRTGRRSPLVYTCLSLIVLFFGAIAAVFVISISTSPALPSVRLNLERQYLSVLAVAHRTPTKAGPSVDLAQARSRVDKSKSGTPRLAFYVNWDKNSFMPFHPGALKYLTEKGITVPDNLK